MIAMAVTTPSTLPITMSRARNSISSGSSSGMKRRVLITRVVGINAAG